MMIVGLTDVIAAVETMGGDPLSEILAPSEIRAIAEVVSSYRISDPSAVTNATYAPHLAWMGSIPPFMHDCFSA